jgi:hypothetical protein
MFQEGTRRACFLLTEIQTPTCPGKKEGLALSGKPLNYLLSQKMHMSVVTLGRYFWGKLSKKINFQGVRSVVMMLFGFDKARDKGYGYCKIPKNTIKGGMKGCT